MILFFKSSSKIYVIDTNCPFNEETIKKLLWLFGEAELIKKDILYGYFVGPRREMITPWSTNAVEITRNMGILGIRRIEEFVTATETTPYDSMLQALYKNIDQEIFTIHRSPAPVISIENIAAYNQSEGLALSDEEIQYLENLSIKLERKLTDSEVFGFSQVNSEHCRHKIFNGTFIIDEKTQPETLFGMIKKTAKVHPNLLVSAYSDNVAFIQGSEIEQFAPQTPDKPDYYVKKQIQTVISLKAETHNFPTTVESFNGAATGSGGEIRDRMAGGKGSIPLVGTAVYMTAYPRSEPGRQWELAVEPRKWLYQTPKDILIKASNGASDFGNKFGQPLICGSVLTFEHQENNKKYAYDKVIMLAGGVGFGKKSDSHKNNPGNSDTIVVMGGDNYRIGMGGGAVSSVATGEYRNAIELNAVQRSNPEMQKRVFNTIRALTETENNPIVSIHDHGAGGHLNSLSELVESTGGKIAIEKLPVGDPTLSAKEIIGNESQERMGLLLKEENMNLLGKISARERAPMYAVGKTTGDHRLVFEDTQNHNKPIDLSLEDFFGKPPRTILTDETSRETFSEIKYQPELLTNYLEQVLQLESVACKDWLTNKVDRSVTSRIGLQQTAGTVQLPLNNLGIAALDYKGEKGIATALGHAPATALINPAAGSQLAIAEALTNIVWAPLTHSLRGVSLSANWMWPCKNPGENARLYEAVKAASEFAIALEINIPTGKDSLSMTQKYPDGETVFAPGTVIITAVAEVNYFRKTVRPVIVNQPGTTLIYIDFTCDAPVLGGSAFAQVAGQIGNEAPAIIRPEIFANAFNAIQQLIQEEKILAGHDVSSGGLITCLLEMLFARNDTGAMADISSIPGKDPIHILFNEHPSVVIQVKELEYVDNFLKGKNVSYYILGEVTSERSLGIFYEKTKMRFDVNHLRDVWFKSSYLLDRHQSGEILAMERFRNYKKQELVFRFPEHFTGKASQFGIDLDRTNPSGIRAAVIREQGCNSEREMAYMLHLAGFDVKDVHMTDLIEGRETLEDVNFIVFVGGFANSDVLGSGKGWAGAFLFNEKANTSLRNFYQRNNTLSLGVCNGCQAMMHLNLIYPEHEKQPQMLHNESRKYESIFLTIDVLPNDSVLLKTLAGARLGIWVSHGEGKFSLPYVENEYHIPACYSYHDYPGNPNGSDYDVACLASADGRHLAIMPHFERAFLPWQWAEYPASRRLTDEISPWMEVFFNARKWVEEKMKTSVPV
ncbi:MAG: phosphoribosylformylglycinamidine synthase [Lentimicrobiaceae bacterium]|nr:phosphoribosylformylglycinamidine synthase [Lentimicrobiaceae bacterium]